MPSAPDTDDVIMKPDAKMQGRRHRMINLLSLLLTGLRAFESDLRALENLNPQINELTNGFSSLPWSDPEVNSIKRRGDFLLLDAAREKDETTQVTEPPRRPSYVEEAMIDFDLHDTDNEERT